MNEIKEIIDPETCKKVSSALVDELKKLPQEIKNCCFKLLFLGLGLGTGYGAYKQITK